MTRRRLAFAALSTLTGIATAAACSSSSTTNNPTSNPDSGTDSSAGGGVDAAPLDALSDAPAQGTFALQVPCTDSAADVYGDPGTTWQSLPKGGIIKCHQDPDIAMADLYATASATSSNDAGSYPGYSGPMFTSGAHVYRVLYRTERGDAAGSPGYSSAIVYVPDHPRAGLLPVIAAAHGSRGQAGHCASSKGPPVPDPDLIENDYYHLVYPIVGGGYTVIVSDLAGYANYGAAGNPPSAYASAQDVGKSTLDSARALRIMLSSSVNPSTILAGHSQGGGTAFAALGISSVYAPEMPITGVTVYAPLWLPARAYAAILLEPGTYPIDNTGSAAPEVSLWYHYTVGELLDGQGHGIDLFQPSKQAAVKSFVDNDCWWGVYPDLEAAAQPTHSANDLFLASFSSTTALAAAIDASCGTDANCLKWMARYAKERPHFTGAAKTVPILLSWGGRDTTMAPTLMACVFDRLKSDAANYKVCYDPAQTHGGIVATQAARVNDWIAGLTLGAAMPADCPENEMNATDDAGKPFACNPLIINNMD